MRKKHDVDIESLNSVQIIEFNNEHIERSKVVRKILDIYAVDSIPEKKETSKVKSKNILKDIHIDFVGQRLMEKSNPYLFNNPSNAPGEKLRSAKEVPAKVPESVATTPFNPSVENREQLCKAEIYLSMCSRLSGSSKLPATPP